MVSANSCLSLLFVYWLPG